MIKHTRFLALGTSLHIYFPESQTAIDTLTCLRDFRFLDRTHIQDWDLSLSTPPLPSNALGVMVFTSDIERLGVLTGHDTMRLGRAFGAALGPKAQLTKFLSDLEQHGKLLKSGR
jgi:hypothetical protein